MNLLTLVLALPAAGSLAVLALPKTNTRAIRITTLAVSLAVFALSLGLTLPFGNAAADSQFVINVPWISSPAIRFHVAVDGVSLWLVLLATLLTPIGILISWHHIDRQVKEFHALMLLLEFGLVGVFVALDLFLFYVFW